MVVGLINKVVLLMEFSEQKPPELFLGPKSSGHSNKVVILRVWFKGEVPVCILNTAMPEKFVYTIYPSTKITSFNFTFHSPPP